MLPPRRRRAWLVLALTFAWLAAGSVSARELVRFIGYTRPGTPPDTIKDNKVRFAAGDDPAAMGGTVYFMVFEASGSNPEDPWETGIQDLTRLFKPGVQSSGEASPGLERGGRYLYLYQIINDRRTPVRMESADIQLGVDASDLLAWGYFEGLGFGVESKDGKGLTEVKPVSFNNIVAASDVAKAYLNPAPTEQVDKNFVLKKLARTEPGPKGKIITVTWDALDPPVAPAFVMLLGPGEKDNKASFRAIWPSKVGLAKEARSTIFGFTSDSPPDAKGTPIYLRSPRGFSDKDKIKLLGVALNDDGEDFVQQEDDTALVAQGRVPTPLAGRPPESPAAGPSLPGGPGGSGSPGGSGGPGGGTGSAFSPSSASLVGNRLGSPLATSFGGGGAGGGSGGGGTMRQQGQATGVVINYQTSLANQQSQQQRQAQSQVQAQAQGQSQSHQGGDHTMVPEPTTIFGALMGLGVLLGLRKKKREPRLIPS